MKNLATGVRIVLAFPGDVRGMQEVFYQGWLATYPNAEHGVTVDDIEDRYKDRYSDAELTRISGLIVGQPEGQATLVAKLDDVRIVGVCRVRRYQDRNQLHAIYVLPEYHGRGIGTALWESAQQHLNPNRVTFVEVATYNTKAIKFYEGLGFVDTGRRMADPSFVMKSGAIIPEMEMRRRVVPASQ